MKNLLKNIALAAFFVLSLLFTHATVAQNTPVPPAEGPSALFQSSGQPETSEEIKLVLPGFDKARAITVTVRDGRAFLDDDIEIGPIEELRNQQEDRGIRIDAAGFRWPSGKIPYAFDTGFSTTYITLINQAINYINGSTHLLLVARTSETNYIKFTPSNGCSSPVGRQTGAQTINLMDPNLNGGTGCWFKAIIHEIAHSAGLWHEQSREDRNNFVTIHLENVIPGKEHNFNQEITGSTDVGAYDFASDMHYNSTAFSSNGQPTITANGGQSFGNATEYSVGDVAALNTMYTTKNCPTSHSLSVEVPTVTRALHYEASGSVQSSALLNTGSTVTYDAGTLIRLVPGFVAKQGMVFRAVIDGCGGNTQSLEGPEVDEWMADITDHQIKDPESEIASNLQKNGAVLLPFEAFPNPVATSTTLQFTLPAAASVNLSVFDLNGKSVLTLLKNKDLPAGQNQIVCPMNSLQIGIYFARLDAENGGAILKVIKVE